MSRASVTLGRDGMGAEATEADYDAWVDYVCDHIDEKCGFEVEVERVHNPRDAQDNRIQADGYGAGDSQTVRDALADLWVDFCDNPTLWPSNQDDVRRELQPGEDGRDPMPRGGW